jgi:hypothetical protein
MFNPEIPAHRLAKKMPQRFFDFPRKSENLGVMLKLTIMQFAFSGNCIFQAAWPVSVKTHVHPCLFVVDSGRPF